MKHNNTSSNKTAAKVMHELHVIFFVCINCFIVRVGNLNYMKEMDNTLILLYLSNIWFVAVGQT